MNKLRSQIDYEKFEAELQEALRSDELYRLQNDAKLRAIEQNVPTYEHFRQMVKAAHLKPLQRGEVKSRRTGIWNSVVDCNRSHRLTRTRERRKMRSDEDEKKDDSVDGSPVTYEQFSRVWKTIEGYQGKFDYLRNIRNVLREKLFRTEVPPNVFAEIIDVCFECVSLVDNVEGIVEILRTLSECDRFGLTISFLKADERKRCAALFRELIVGSTSRNELKRSVESLASTYGTELADNEM